MTIAVVKGMHIDKEKKAEMIKEIRSKNGKEMFSKMGIAIKQIGKKGLKNLGKMEAKPKNTPGLTIKEYPQATPTKN